MPQSNLGPPIKTYKQDSVRIFLQMLIGLAFIVAIGICSTPLFERSIADTWWVWLLFLGVATFGALIIRRNLTCRNLRVTVHANGFEVNDRGDMFVCRWDQVANVCQGAEWWQLPDFPLGMRHYVLVERNDGSVCLLDGHIQNVHKLGERIQEESYRFLMNSAWSRFQSGETVGIWARQVEQERPRAVRKAPGVGPAGRGLPG
jgi:hypothetical protein